VEVLSGSLAWFVPHQFGLKQGLGQDLVPNTTVAAEFDPVEKIVPLPISPKNSSATTSTPATSGRSFNRSSIAPQYGSAPGGDGGRKIHLSLSTWAIQELNL